MEIILEVEIKGKLFDLKAKPIVDAIKRSVQTLVEKGEGKLFERLRARPAGVFLSVAEAGKKATKGHYYRNIQGKVEGLRGVIRDGNVIYGPWLEGIGSRNITTRFKGYHSFRLTAQELQQEAPKIVRKQVEQAMRELNQ